MIPLVMRRVLRAMRNPPSKARIASLMVAVLAYGTTGFMYFEVPVRPDLRWVDAGWWALATVTTVGYGDVAPQSIGGRVVVALPLMLFGIGLLGYSLSLAATSLIEAKSKETRGMAQLQLKNHVLLINFPSLAKVARVVDELRHPNSLGPDMSIVLVDEDLEQLPPELERRHVGFVRGNPARDETLDRANADDAARAIVLAKRPGDPHSDDLALAVTLAIEARRRRVVSVVECLDPASEELLRKAGADSIVCAARYDSGFLSNEVRHPGVQEVIGELLTSLRGHQIHFTAAPAATRFAELGELCRVRGHLAIGVRRGRELVLNLEPSFLVRAGDELVTIGQQSLGTLQLDGEDGGARAGTPPAPRA